MFAWRAPNHCSEPPFKHAIILYLTQPANKNYYTFNICEYYTLIWIWVRQIAFFPFKIILLTHRACIFFCTCMLFFKRIPYSFKNSDLCTHLLQHKKASWPEENCLLIVNNYISSISFHRRVLLALSYWCSF